MLRRHAAFVCRYPKLLLAVAAVLLGFAAVAGTHVFGVLKSGGFDDPGADSTRARQLIDARFGGQTNIVLLVRAPAGTVDEPSARQTGTELTHALAAESGVDNVASYWTTGAPTMKSTDGRLALVVGHIAGDDKQVAARADTLVQRYHGDRDGLAVQVGGEAVANRDVHTEVNRSLALAESVAVPLTLVLLVLVFGSVASALLPLLIGGVAIVGTFAELYLLGSLTDVSVFAVNLTTALGLGLSVDYALLVVSRFRECLAAGDSVPNAVARTVCTAGRTILFSAATVAAALTTLLLFPQYFLRSFAYAGVGVVVIAAATALVLAPAALALLGHRVNAGRLRWSQATRGAESPVWGRLAGAAMRRPVLTALPVLGLLLLAASPMTHVSFGTPDQGTLPHRSVSRQVADTIQNRFAGNLGAATDVVVTGPVRPEAVRSYAVALSGLPGVAAVSSSAGTFTRGVTTPVGPANAALARPDAQRLSVVTDVAPKSPAAQRLVRAIRGVPGPDGAPALVSSSDARLRDTRAAIGRRLPVAGALVALTTFVLLAGFTRSVRQPLRALLLNGLSLAATLGLMTWIFQQGHLSSVLGFTPRPLDTSMTVLLLCIAFGLSMDYEIFVISRITELRGRRESTRTAVTNGLARTGRIVSAAAGLLAVSFFAFGTSSVSFLQMFGLGAGIAVLLDATLIRGVLVPAVLGLLDRGVLYAPRHAVLRGAGVAQVCAVPLPDELAGPPPGEHRRERRTQPAPDAAPPSERGDVSADPPPVRAPSERAIGRASVPLRTAALPAPEPVLPTEQARPAAPVSPAPGPSEPVPAAEPAPPLQPKSERAESAA